MTLLINTKASPYSHDFFNYDSADVLFLTKMSNRNHRVHKKSSPKYSANKKKEIIQDDWRIKTGIQLDIQKKLLVGTNVLFLTLIIHLTLINLMIKELAKLSHGSKASLMTQTMHKEKNLTHKEYMNEIKHSTVLKIKQKVNTRT